MNKLRYHETVIVDCGLVHLAITVLEVLVVLDAMVLYSPVQVQCN